MIKYALLLLGFAITSPATAQSRETELPLRSEQVRFADLNIMTPIGKVTLRHRIEVAASRLCGKGTMADMEGFLETAACYRGAYWDGIRQMNRIVGAARNGTALASGAVVVVSAH